jgi:myosin-1
VVKTAKDQRLPQKPPGDVIYKSGSISASDGDLPRSISRPTPRAKQVASRPITQGKLLKPGGPSGGPSKLASRPAQSRVVPVSRQTPASSTNFSQPLAALNGSAASNTGGINRIPPPPPPPPASAASQDPTCRALYDFAGQTAGEMSVKQGDVVIIVKKETNGMLSAYGRPYSDKF